MPRHECQNCSKEWPDKEIKPIKDLYERVEPGEPMPSGECPECGALTHQINYYTQPVLETRVYLMRYTMAATTAEEARNMAELGDTVEEKQLKCDGVTNRVPTGSLVMGDQPEEKHVELIPGLTTPEGQKRTAQLLFNRNELDYQCFMHLNTLLGYYDLSAVPKYELDRAHELIGARQQANHEFLYAASGRDADGKTQDNS